MIKVIIKAQAMNSAYAPTYIGRDISIKSLRDYILDAGLTDVDTILLNQINFDELALEYKLTYKGQLPDPYVLLGVLIREGHSVRQGFVSVIENDTESIREKPVENVDPYRIIYRCGYCGNIVDHDGSELDPAEVAEAENYLNKFGRVVTTEHEVGYFCKERYYQDMGYEEPKPAPVVTRLKNDYSSIKDKPLMKLTEEDFKNIGLGKGETPEFQVIYSCQNRGLSKIYFTPNESTYTLRGYMLRAEAEILTTEELIKAIKDWREN